MSHDVMIQFSTPAFAVPDQLPYLPMTFITYDVAAIDGENHKVKLYYDNTAEVCVGCETGWKEKPIFSLSGVIGSWKGTRMIQKRN